MVSRKPFSGTPAKRVLMHYAMNDAQVCNLCTLNLARSIGVVLFEGNPTYVSPTL
jgi:hypothetical protein